MVTVTGIRDYVQRWLSQPGEQVSLTRRAIATTASLVAHCFREMKHDRAEEMAAALTYRTIFSLVPMVVLALLVFRAFGGFHDVGQQVETWLYNYFGLSALTYTTPQGTTETLGVGNQPAAAPSSAPETTRAEDYDDTTNPPARAPHAANSIQDKLVEVTGRINFTSIGTVGMLLFIWAALALAISVESSFNLIYNSPHGRPWHLKITIYWAIITLGPVLLFVSLYLGGRFNDWVGTVATVPKISNESTAGHFPILPYLGAMLGWLLGVVSYFTALVASWLLLFLLYMLMPTTRVNLRAATVGSLVAACFWEAGKYGFKLYVSYAVPYSKLYGTLGLIPLFFFWVYLTWLIVLFGLELTYTLQFLKTRRLKYLLNRADDCTSVDPEWVIPLLALIGRAFERGEVVGEAELATQLHLPPRAVADLAGRLEKEGVLHRVDKGDQSDRGYTLAQPADRVPVRRLLELAHNITQAQGPQENRSGAAGWDYLDRLNSAQRDAAGQTTLADVINRKEGDNPAG